MNLQPSGKTFVFAELALLHPPLTVDGKILSKAYGEAEQHGQTLARHCTSQQDSIPPLHTPPQPASLPD